MQNDNPKNIVAEMTPNSNNRSYPRFLIISCFVLIFGIPILYYGFMYLSLSYEINYNRNDSFRYKLLTTDFLKNHPIFNPSGEPIFTLGGDRLGFDLLRYKTNDDTNYVIGESEKYYYSLGFVDMMHILVDESSGTYKMNSDAMHGLQQGLERNYWDEKTGHAVKISASSAEPNMIEVWYR